MSLNQYFINLRQEAPPTAERIQAYHYYRCGITPQEVDGLRAVLQLITLVVKKAIVLTCLIIFSKLKEITVNEFVYLIVVYFDL